MRLRSSLLLALAMTAVPLAAALLVVTQLWAATEQNTARERTLTEARATGLALGTMIQESRRVLDVLVRDPSLDWSRRDEILKVLALYEGHFDFSRGIFLFAPEGRLVVRDAQQESISVADRPWFQNVVADRKFTVGEFVLSRLTGIPALPMADVVVRQGRIVAILGMSIDLSWYYKRIEANEGLQSTTLTIVGRDGTVLVRYPNPDHFVGKPFPAQDILARVLAGNDVAATFPGMDGIERLYSVKSLEVENEVMGAIVVGVPTEAVLKTTRAAEVLSWAAVVTAVLLTTIFSAFGLRALVLRPIAGLASHTQRLASGHFSARLGTTALPEELGRLARAIDTMAESLEKRDQELAQHRSHLEEMVSERTSELEASRRELQRSNEELQQFAYVASHDLQEPLRMVASFTQLLEQKYRSELDDQAQKYIHFAVDGATRMQQLINDLLTYSRVETQTRSFVSLPAGESVTLALQNLAVLIHERRAQVVVDDLPQVSADPGQLVQVFQNLIANGIKFNRSEVPRVHVGARVRGKLVEFTVEDNGIGIDAEFSERVFVIFQRLNPRGEFSGTGIGLAVCRRVVEKHGGTIRHEPAPEGGSRFIFTIKKA